MKTYVVILVLVLGNVLISCGQTDNKSKSTVAGTSKSAADTLPEPYATKSVNNFSNVLGWENGRMPTAPAGFTVTKYADGFNNPRWMYVTPNGDVLVAESNSRYSAVKKIGAAIVGASKAGSTANSADRITLLRDVNKDGIPDVRTTLLEDLKQPFGMLVYDKWLYVANTDAVLRFPYTAGDTIVKSKGEKITDMPTNDHNNHWTRNIILNPAKTKIYISVGSGSNVAENGIEAEHMRANILEINPDGTGKQVYASGLRNPVGMGFAPGTNVLWTAVNERDELGDDLVPDYLTHVQQGGFYGWPYSYFGQHEDPRLKGQRPDLVKKAIVPDIDLGSHTASLGLAFYNGKAFPQKYHGGVFVAQHGSWNRSMPSGYKVVFVPFKNGKPSGAVEDFLTGFIADAEKNKAYGRPVGVIETPDGALLVTDDKTNTIWRIAKSK